MCVPNMFQRKKKILQKNHTMLQKLHETFTRYFNFPKKFLYYNRNVTKREIFMRYVYKFQVFTTFLLDFYAKKNTENNIFATQFD